MAPKCCNQNVIIAVTRNMRDALLLNSRWSDIGRLTDSTVDHPNEDVF